MSKRYLYLLAWVEGSDSASGEATAVHGQTDLLPQYLAGNEHVFALEVSAPSAELAGMAGDSRAFHENYTGYDTVSIVEEIPTSFQHPGPIVAIAI